MIKTDNFDTELQELAQFAKVFSHPARLMILKYLAEKKVLELHGEDAKVWSGKNVVRGKKITVYYTENRSLVEGATGDQVEATLFVKEGGGLIE